MGMTAVEKVLAAKSGRSTVKPGDVVSPDPDFIMIHDGVVMAAKRELDALGITRLATPDKVLMVTDHDVIYGSARAAERGAFNRKAAAQWGVKNFFDVGRGGHGHIFPMESGLLLPGMFYFDNDRHATNAGAIGAFGFRMGTEISRVLATGTNWVFRDESAHIEFALEVIATVRRERPHLFDAEFESRVREMIREAVECEAHFAEDTLSGGVSGLSSASMRQYLEYIADRRLSALGIAPMYGSKNPFDFMELQDVQELTNFFERRVSAYQVAITGEVNFAEEF